MFPILIHNKKGIVVVEILIVIGIIAIVVSSLLGVVVFSLKLSASVKETTIADALAREAVEVTRSIRDSDWNKITNGNHGLTNTGGYWDFSGTENIINGFTRAILIEDVQRDNNNNIVESGGTNDPDTKKVTVTVSWENRKVEIITYFTNWR